MNAIERIVAARGVGEVIVGTLPYAATLGELATRFGLGDAVGTYHEVPRDEATAVLEAVLHRDMAYDQQIVTLQRARRLARAFVAGFDAATTRFYTNGSWGLPRHKAGVGAGWQPATDATFDTGVLAIGATSSACVWFKHED